MYRTKGYRGGYAGPPMLETVALRRRSARCITAGGVCTCVGTFMPWVIIRYANGWWSWTGMHLTYAHFPPITIGYVSILLGGTAIWLGRKDARQPGYAQLGIVPASVEAFFLGFINSSLHGHLGERLATIKGFSGAWLGPGYWLMMIGTALVVVGVVGATYATVPSQESVLPFTRERTQKISVSDQQAGGRELVVSSSKPRTH
jgi:hypothetical protein